MPYEVCYRALLSISVVEGLEATHTRRSGLPAARAGAPRRLQRTTPYCGPRSPGSIIM